MLKFFLTVAGVVMVVGVLVRLSVSQSKLPLPSVSPTPITQASPALTPPASTLPLTTPTLTPTPTHVSVSPTSTPTPINSALPEKVFLDVTFLVQAPKANWDPPHEEACEEAALVMVKYYLDQQALVEDDGDREMLKMADWEAANGYGLSVTLEELRQIAQKYYGISNGKVKTDISVEDIKRELAAGRPVIVPLAGRQLRNPYFTPPGPIYHMLVIKGYDSDGFITNENGIRQGKDYRYSFDTLYQAIHDYNPEDINKGAKAYLVF